MKDEITIIKNLIQDKPGATTLDLRFTNITDAGVAGLEEALPNLKVFK